MGERFIHPSKRSGKTQGAGCRALESALHVPGVSLGTLARDGLLRSLTLAHQRCPESRSVALSLCRVMGKVMLQSPEHLTPEVGISALSAGASLPRDAEVEHLQDVNLFSTSFAWEKILYLSFHDG